MNKELNIILGMMAGSGAFKIRFHETHEWRGWTWRSTSKYQLGYQIFGRLQREPQAECTLFAKRPEDMSRGEIERYIHMSSMQAERYLISNGYLPEYLAEKLTEAGIKTEWICTK